MMSEGSNAGGFNKSRSVLGDVTNRPGKRGFSEREKSYNSNVKHVRVELDLLKRRISKAATENNNNGLKFQDLDGGCVFSERSIDIEVELTRGHGNSEEVNGDNDVKLCEKKAECPCVSSMFAVDNGSVNTLADMASSVHAALTMRDKVSSRNCKDTSFTDLDMGGAFSSVDSKACVSLPSGKFDSLKGYKMLEIPDAVTENTSSKLRCTVKSNVVDVAKNSSADVASSVTKISKSSYLNLLDLGRNNGFRCANIKAKNKLGDVASANALSTVTDIDSDCLLGYINCDAGEANVSLEGTQKDCMNYLNEVEGHNADNFITNQSESNKCKEYPCIGGGVDAIKTCSCSFCTKAAYMWLDLNYQDIRGRVSAMRKSQKEASILAERNRMTKETEKNETEGFTRISKLEIDLMHQWKFLFQHMASIWEQEGDHLETSLSPLTDLREKCKRDLGSD